MPRPSIRKGLLKMTSKFRSVSRTSANALRDFGSAPPAGTGGASNQPTETTVVGTSQIPMEVIPHGLQGDNLLVEGLQGNSTPEALDAHPVTTTTTPNEIVGTTTPQSQPALSVAVPSNAQEGTASTMPFENPVTDISTEVLPITVLDTHPVAIPTTPGTSGANDAPTLKSSLFSTKTAKNVFKGTLVILNDALEGLPIPGAKGIINTVIKLIQIIEDTEANREALDTLNTHCLRLRNIISISLNGKGESEIPSGLRRSIDRFNVNLHNLLEDIQNSRSGRLLGAINNKDDSSTIKEINDKITQLVDYFLLETHISGAMTLEDISQFVKQIQKYELDQLIQNLPHANAAFDSYVAAHTRTTCFKNTGQQLLSEITVWITDSNVAPIYVLDGIAGIGKSTVARTIAEHAAYLGYLGASFFFSRAEGKRNNAELFFSTIAYQLACFRQDFAIRIAEALRKTPDAAYKRLEDQLQHLIVEPLQGIQMQHSIVIVLDALDECQKEDATNILTYLVQGVKDLPLFKIFVTARPEPHLRRVLLLNQYHHQFHLHEIERSIVKSDIEAYFKHNLLPKRIQEILPDAPEWQPTQNDIDILVDSTGILFIIASTSLRFIFDEQILDPQAQMEQLSKAFSSGKENIDAVYMEILRNAIPDKLNKNKEQLFQKVVGTIALLENP